MSFVSEILSFVIMIAILYVLYIFGKAYFKNQKEKLDKMLKEDEKEIRK